VPSQEIVENQLMKNIVAVQYKLLTQSEATEFIEAVKVATNYELNAFEEIYVLFSKMLMAVEEDRRVYIARIIYYTTKLAVKTYELDKVTAQEVNDKLRLALGIF
jgi:hypothetical protein